VNKRIFLFVVCGTSPDEKEKLQKYVEASVPPAILERLHVYFLQGRLIYKKLSWMDKFMLRMGAMLTRDPKVKKEMLTDYDDVKKLNLLPLITAIRKLALASGVVYPE
jgi:menaquinone-dependent protoporphyrinogen IX oxidase